MVSRGWSDISIRTWLGAYAPPSRAARALVAAAVTDSVGSGLYLAGAVLYFVRVVGLSPTQIGTGLTAAGFAAFACMVPIGMLGDRVGAVRTLALLQGWRAVMLVVLAFVSGFGGFLAATVAMTVAARSVSPVTQAVVAGAIDEPDRVPTMAIMRSARNVGYSVGAALAVPIAAVDQPWAYRLALLLNAMTFVFSVLLLLRLRVPHVVRDRRPRRPGGFRDGRFVGLAALNGLLSLHMTMLPLAVPLWVLATGAPRWLVSVVLIVNTVLAVALQVASTRGCDEPGFGPRALRRAGTALAACCLLLAAAGAVRQEEGALVAALLAGAVALTVGEVLQSAGGWDLSFRFAPADRSGEYLAVFNLGTAVQDIAGPLLLTVVVAHGGAGWTVLAAVFALAAVVVVPAAGAAGRRHVTAPG